MNDVRSVLARLVESVKQGDSISTYDCLDKLVTTKPPLNNSWLGVAKMALMSGEVDKAKQALQLFVPSVQNTIADKLQKLAMLIEAGQINNVFEQGLVLEKTNPQPEVKHFLSTVSLQLGNIELASKYAQQVLDKWPDSGQAWLILVSAKKVASGDPIIQQMDDVTEAVARSKNYESVSSFYAAKCKVCVDLKDHHQALQFATLANESLKATHQYDASQDQQNAQFITSQVSSSVIEQSTELSACSNNPIFIIGLPRSGTSLLEQMLCSNSEVLDGGEISGMERASRCLTKGQPIGSHADHFSPQLIDKHAENIKAAYLRYAQQRFGNTGIIVDKSMTNNRYLWLIKRVFPQSPIIMIDRDILDCAWSCYRTHFSSGFNWSLELATIGKYFSIEKTLSEFWKATYSDTLFSINYNDLVNEPELAMQKLCEFCGIKYEHQMLEFYKSKRPVFTASVAQVRQGIHQKALGQGRLIKEKLQPFIDNYKFKIE